MGSSCCSWLSLSVWYSFSNFFSFLVGTWKQRVKVHDRATESETIKQLPLIMREGPDKTRFQRRRTHSTCDRAASRPRPQRKEHWHVCVYASHSFTLCGCFVQNASLEISRSHLLLTTLSSHTVRTQQHFLK